MMHKTIYDFKQEKPTGMRVLVGMNDGGAATVTIRELLGLQQSVLNQPCQYCGSRGKYDIRGNCGACGAPQ